MQDVHGHTVLLQTPNEANKGNFDASLNDIVTGFSDIFHQWQNFWAIE